MFSVVGRDLDSFLNSGWNVAEDEINLAGKTVRLDVKMVFCLLSAALTFVLWLMSISNKLDLLAMQVGSQMQNRYTSVDARRDFEIRDERFTNLKSEVDKLTSVVELNRAKLAQVEQPLDPRKIYSNKVP